jgi:membrane-associated protease RseP (regulator of RpoE activity)
MRKYVLTSIVLLPLLLSFSHAAQIMTVNPEPYVFSSDEGGTSAYLGVDIADVTSERMSTLKLKEEKGVEVTMVDQDAPAGKAGIKEHDVILTMNGTSVDSAAQLRRMIRETPPGRVVTLGLSRDGQPMTVKVQLADKHKEYSYVAPKDFHVEIPEIHVPEIDIPSFNMVVVTSSARSGLTVENITPQLGEFFGVKNGNGVLVRSVAKGSRAEKAGFRAGDVIVKVNDEPVHDTSDFTHAVRLRKGGSVSVGVFRDKKEQTLTLTFPEQKESGALFEEESSGQPLLNAQAAQELSEVQTEIAKLRPQLELATENARKSVEAWHKAYCEQQRKFREQTEKQRQELRKQQEELRNDLRRMRQEFRRNLLDI